MILTNSHGFNSIYYCYKWLEIFFSFFVKTKRRGIKKDKNVGQEFKALR